MAYSIFLDVNIVADFLDNQRPEHDTAVTLFRNIEDKVTHAYFSESVVNTTSYILRKLMSFAEFKNLMIELVNVINILPCTNDTVINGYHIAKNDLEDAVLYQIALENRLDYFITSDIKDYKKIAHPLLPVINSKQMVALLQ